MATASSALVRTNEATFLRGLAHNRSFILEAAGIIGVREGRRVTVGASGSLSWECPWGFVVLKAFVLWAIEGVLSTEFPDHRLCARPMLGLSAQGAETVAPPGVAPELSESKMKIKENSILAPGSGCDPEVSVGQHPGRLPRGGGAGVTELGVPLGGWNK